MKRFKRPVGVTEEERLQIDIKKLLPRVRPYSLFVPFDLACSVIYHTLESSDEFIVDDTKPDEIGFGAIYHLVADGVHTPTFDSTFVKSSGSSDYDPTVGVHNLITFIYDGGFHWYSIIQPV